MDLALETGKIANTKGVLTSLLSNASTLCNASVISFPVFLPNLQTTHTTSSRGISPIPMLEKTIFRIHVNRSLRGFSYGRMLRKYTSDSPSKKKMHRIIYLDPPVGKLNISSTRSIQDIIRRSVLCQSILFRSFTNQSELLLDVVQVL